MIFIIANQKGGVGKTTLATNIAVALSKKGNTVLVDADDQQSAMKWSKRRTENSIDTEAHKGDLKKVLLDLQKKYEYVVLDVAGRDSEEFRTALQVGDKLIVPTQPSQTDVEALPHVLKMYNTFQKVNEKLQPFIVINKAPSNTKSTEVADTIELLQTLPKFKLLNAVIRDRKQWRDAMIQGLSVAEMNSSKAKDEFNEFLVEIL
ncbi:AAA family ATPase [Acinetobacter bereziniae]|uniref:AAA family ATPase n=1 Tax=Acinetobacter bereziniae TaxID=106648 RepID=UPI002FDA62CC